MRFIKSIAAAAAALVCLPAAAFAAPVTIDFTEAEFTAGFLPATDEYAALGVIFSDFSFYDDGSGTFDPTDGRGIFNGAFDGTSVQQFLGRIDFINGTDSVSIDWISFIANIEFGLAAFDANDNLITSVVGNTGTDATGTLGLMSPSIAYVLFGGTGNAEPVGITALTFNAADAVPLPGAVLLFATGLAGLSAARRRKAA